MRYLDLASLRSFLLIAGGHSFTATAQAVGRTASAVTQQMQKLEADLGQSLVLRERGRNSLTPAGEKLLPLARRMLAINEEAMLDFHAAPPRPLRLGVTQDIAEILLPSGLRRFNAACPGTAIDLRVERSDSLLDGLHQGLYDLAVVIEKPGMEGGTVLGSLPMIWIGRADTDFEADATLPLALFDPPCSYRQAALSALDTAGRPYRLALTSPSVTGLRGAAEAGIALTVRTRHLLKDPLADVGARLHLPDLPDVRYIAHTGGDPWPERDLLLEIIRGSLS
ncbi:LysR substrate-binding domain-containing protein [Lacibacterium aquatile]|uniref:LysR substrate-binding domain-containing protein n=1 Tax=Lacibacterium aquatile TaxID=1168082 RepID=A0ABW5DJK3_9PROT